MSFTYSRIIRVQDTDATGVIYFANQLQIALEAFEEFLRVSGFSLSEMIQKQNFLLPIVHTEADFFLPLTVGDEVDVSLAFTHIGTSSFTHFSTFTRLDGQTAGTASIIHVVYSPKLQKSQPIPNQLKDLFIIQ